MCQFVETICIKDGTARHLHYHVERMQRTIRHFFPHMPMVAESDLLCEVPIPFPLAAAGGDLYVPTISGKTKIRVPAGTQSGAILRLKGKGAPSLRGGGRGDLHIRLIVETPTGLSKEQLELLEKFNASLTPKNQRRQSEFAERAKNFLQGE